MITVLLTTQRERSPSRGPEVESERDSDRACLWHLSKRVDRVPGETITSRFLYLYTCAHKNRIWSVIVDTAGKRTSGWQRDVETLNDTGRLFNNLLRRLSASDFALIAPHLAYEEAKVNVLLYSPGDMSRSSTSRAGRVLCHTWSPTRTAARSKPYWSAAKEPSAELSARDIYRPIRASWSSSAGHSCACMSESSTARKQSRLRCATCSPAMPTACWPRYSSRRPATPSIRSSSAPRNGSCRRWSVPTAKKPCR